MDGADTRLDDLAVDGGFNHEGYEDYLDNEMSGEISMSSGGVSSVSQYCQRALKVLTGEHKPVAHPGSSFPMN